MSKFTKSGTAYFPATGFDVVDELPLGTYIVSFDMNRGYFFQAVPPVKADVPKFYGDLVWRRDRILNTFSDRQKSNTGVMLTGNKGSGKSLLARAVCEKAAADMDMPVIMVTQPHHGDGFNTLLENIGRPCVLFFDEFEKVYVDHGHQAQMLGVFDGTFSQRMLMIVTCNDQKQLVDFFHNRPGRFFYRWHYGPLSEDFIRSYANDNLVNKEDVASLINVSSLYSDFNFDILKAFVEEMNRYSETAKQVAPLINATPEGHVSYDIVDWELDGGKPTMARDTDYEADDPSGEFKIHKIEWNGNPFNDGAYMRFIDKTWDRTFDVHFKAEDLKSFKDGIVTVKTESHGIEVKAKLKKRPFYTKEYWDAAF